MFSALNFFLAGGKGSATIVQTFTASGNWTAPTGVTQIDSYLVVAGGGGGGGASGLGGGRGGGGAGGYLTGTNYAVTAGTPYAITIGAGGPGGAASEQNGTVGSVSSWNTNAVGGGAKIESAGGGFGNGYVAPYTGGSGGSGGGSSQGNTLSLIHI